MDTFDKLKRKRKRKSKAAMIFARTCNGEQNGREVGAFHDGGVFGGSFFTEEFSGCWWVW